MKKPTPKTVSPRRKYAIIATVIALSILVLFGAVYGFYKIQYYNKAADQANLVTIRELLISSVNASKKTAPVEPRTGDVYFPESKLYVPNPEMAVPLTYAFYKGDAADPRAELSIGTYPVRGTEALYMAQDQTSLFAAVPKLQACARGIKLVYQKPPDSGSDNQLKHEVQLKNGKTLYIYLEKACPELTETTNLLQNIQSY